MKHGALKAKAKRAFAPPVPNPNTAILPVAPTAAQETAPEGEGDPFVGTQRPQAGEMRRTPLAYAQKRRK